MNVSFSELFLCIFPFKWLGFCCWSRTFWTGRVLAISFQIAWCTLFRELYNGVWHQLPSCSSSKNRATTVTHCSRGLYIVYLLLSWLEHNLEKTVDLFFFYFSTSPRTAFDFPSLAWLGGKRKRAAEKKWDVTKRRTINLLIAVCPFTTGGQYCSKYWQFVCSRPMRPDGLKQFAAL